MPSHPDRVRRNYEPAVIDGRPCANPKCTACAPWRRPSETNAEQLQRRADTGITANVIEGDPFNFWGV